MATNRDFAYIQQDIAEYEKQEEDRTATINEQDAIKEREQIIAETKARDDERENRPLPEAQVYELTVKNSSDPGLPAPMSYFTTNTVTESYQEISRSFTTVPTQIFLRFRAKCPMFSQKAQIWWPCGRMLRISDCL